MDPSERVRKALEVLGGRVLKARRPGLKKKTKPVSSFVPRKKRHSMTRSEYEQCGKKTRYNTLADARKYARQLSGQRGYPIRAYECPYCAGFHLTHKPLKQRRKAV